jgi:3D (Asp-Asp-Asp) domain-containing protein
MKRLFLAPAFVAACIGIAAMATPVRDSARIVLPPAPLSPPQQASAFLLDAPEPGDIRAAMKLWATWYHMPTVQAAARADAAPLMGLKGEPISLPIAARDWCDAATQGSVWVEGPDGETRAYVFIDDDGPEQIDCDSRLGDLSAGIKSATRRARFAAFHHPRGCDVRRYPLLPYRTIATDPKRIPMGSVVYAPGLRGQTFWLEGQLFTHDGYLFASDRGGAIKDNHIDMFLADVARAPLPDMIGSSARHTFQAFLVAPEAPAAMALKAMQETVCDEDAPADANEAPKPQRRGPDARI